MSGMGVSSTQSIEEFLNDQNPLVDVRSPKEFKKGHCPGATNIPILNDEQRHLIGTSYKNDGRKKAISLGLKLISPSLKELNKKFQELSGINNLYPGQKTNISLKIYCWRGGMRSASAAWLANLSHIKVLILKGGYKAYRNWVLKQFEKDWPIKLIGGKTGTGKTDLLLELKAQGTSVIDLEGLANHRGSSFGGLGQPPQPSCEQYENLLASQLREFTASSNNEIWLEDESSHLGQCRIPQGLFKQMKEAPILEITRSDEERVENLVNVYSQCGLENLSIATERISRRLGPQRTSEALQAIACKDWRQACLAMLDYYDRCYEFELSKAKRITRIDLSCQKASKAAALLLTKGLVK